MNLDNSQMKVSASNNSLLTCCIALLIAALLTPDACGQAFSRLEVGAQYTALRLREPSGVHFKPGFGGRFDFNLTRRFALESQVDFIPANVPPTLVISGGSTFQALVGVRARVIRTRKFGVFGILRPGWTRFNHIPVYEPGAVVTTEPANYFTVNLGGGVEFYPNSRWIARVELGNNLVRVPNSSIAPLGLRERIGGVDDAVRFSAGVGYRLGTLREPPTEKAVGDKLTLGTEFSTLILQREVAGMPGTVKTELGFGGFVSYKLLHFLYADSSLFFFPQSPEVAGFHEGGRILQGLIGIKGGVRGDRWGLFAKLRPGFHIYSAARAADFAIGQMPSRERVTSGVLDLGGVVEFYPSRRSVIRFDAGDTHIYFGSRSGKLPDGTRFIIPGVPREHSIQFGVGYGLRF